MPQRHRDWLTIQLGSIVASLLGIRFFALDDTKALLVFIPAAILTWIFRPKDWKDAFSDLLSETNIGTQTTRHAATCMVMIATGATAGLLAGCTGPGLVEDDCTLAANAKLTALESQAIENVTGGRLRGIERHTECDSGGTPFLTAELDPGPTGADPLLQFAEPDWRQLDEHEMSSGTPQSKGFVQTDGSAELIIIATPTRSDSYSLEVFS